VQQDQRRKDTGEFWGDIGKDEIHWWIFKNELCIPRLKQKTEAALLSAKTLKDDSKKLCMTFDGKYGELIDSLDEFVNNHEEEITRLLNYVEELNRENEMAPSILFTYRVWGSTNQYERTSVNKLGHVVIAMIFKSALRLS
jgi:hypothetical protein